jgi:hypothetical protein
MSVLRIAVLATSDGRELALIRNISTGGAKIDASPARSVGDQLSLEFTNTLSLAARVVWQRENEFGVQFLQPVNVQDALSARDTLPRNQQPRAPRVGLSCKATIRNGGRVREVVLVDLSQQGAKFDITEPLTGGELCLDVPGLPPLRAGIRWQSGDRAGICFTELIGFRQLVDWLAEHRHSMSHAAMRAVGLLGCASTPAAAAETRSGLSVSATVVESCTVNSQPGQPGRVLVRCSPGALPDIGKPPDAAAHAAPQPTTSNPHDGGYVTITY